MNTSRPFTTSRQVFHVLVILTMLFSQFGLAVGNVAAIEPPPGDFGKDTPADGANDLQANPTLSWRASSYADTYEYCITTTDDHICHNPGELPGVWTSVGASTSVSLSGLLPATTYFWQVAAVNLASTKYADTGLDTDDGSRWSFNTLPYVLHVNLKGNEVHGHQWPSGDTVTLIVDDDTDPGNGDLYHQTKNADDAPDCGYPCFNLQGLFTLQVGQFVTMTDGTVTKTVQVSSLQIDEVNAGNETVSGVADPGSSVLVKINSQGGNERIINAADPSGAWLVDFTIPGDGASNPATTLGIGDQGAAIQLIPGTVEDGTLEYWEVPNPRFTVQPDHGWVQGEGWPVGHTLSLTVADPGNGSCSVDDQTVADDGSAWFQVEPKCDLHMGETVSLTDGSITKSTVIQEVHFDTIHETTNIAIGRGLAGQPANVYVRTDTAQSGLDITIGSGGDWTAEFSGLPPIHTILDANIKVFDPDGDATMAHLRIPKFQARMTENELPGMNWPLGATVTATIDDPLTPGMDFGPVTSTSIVAPWDPSQTFAPFHPDTFKLAPGQVITMTDGNIIKTLTVTDLLVTNINTSLDTVSGTSSSGDIVEVGYLCDPGGCALRRVNPSGGAWSVDFKAAPGAPTPEEQYPYDIKGGDRNEAIQYDMDNDATERIWKVVYPDSVSVPAGSQIQLAAPIDLSDGAADLGQSALKAIQMAVADFGRVKGFTVKINSFDSQCGDPFVGYQAAAQVIANTQNVGVLGHTCSPSFSGGLPVYESVGMVTISGSATAPDLPALAQTVFNRTTLSDPFADGWWPVIQNLPGVIAWNARYHALYGEDPAPYAVLNYDATTLMLQRIKKNSALQVDGSLLINRSDLAGAVRATTNYNGVSGSFSFDSNGNRIPVCYALNTGVNPGGAGNVVVDPGSNCTGGYYAGTVVRLTATNAPGYNFSNWSGVVSGSTNPVNLTMDGNKSVTANFVVTLPAAFVKNSPVNAAVIYSTSQILNWQPSTGASGYAYCFDTSNNNNCNTSWVNVGSSLSATLNGLSPNTTYYWQVRAVNSGGSTDANAGAWWSFSTVGCYTLNAVVNPGGAGYLVPSPSPAPNCGGGRYIAGTVVQLTAIAYSGFSFSTWSGAVSGSTNPVTLTMNADKNLTANFVVTPPAAFVKSSPGNAATNVATSLTLTWQSSQRATSYQYCVDTSNNNSCDTGWVSVVSPSAGLSGLLTNTTYYWQVRALNSGGTMYANGNATSGTWWSFSTVNCYTLTTIVTPGGAGSVYASPSPTCPSGRYYTGTSVQLTANPASGYGFSSWSGAVSGSTNPVTLTMNGNKSVTANFVVTPPSAFYKDIPANGATNVTRTPTLRWTNSTWVTRYEYCIDTSNNNVCNTSWVNAYSSQVVTLSSLSANTTYYWQVRAVNSGGTTYANAGTWWSFKTRP